MRHASLFLAAPGLYPEAAFLPAAATRSATLTYFIAGPLGFKTCHPDSLCLMIITFQFDISHFPHIVS